jgi:hypothetical protein
VIAACCAPSASRRGLRRDTVGVPQAGNAAPSSTSANAVARTYTGRCGYAGETLSLAECLQPVPSGAVQRDGFGEHGFAGRGHGVAQEGTLGYR